MAGQAGWYRAPGEEGLLRYWSGTAWTEHRQPVPDAVPAPVAEAAPVVEAAPEPVAEALPEPVAAVQHESDPVLSMPSSSWDPPDLSTEPDWSMDQFEKQFEQEAAAESDEPPLAFEPDFTRDFGSPAPGSPGADAGSAHPTGQDPVGQSAPGQNSPGLDSPGLDSRNFDDFASIFSSPSASPSASPFASSSGAQGISAQLAAAPAPTPVQVSTAIPMPAASAVAPETVAPQSAAPETTATGTEAGQAEASGVAPEAPELVEPELITVTDADAAASVSRFSPDAPLSAALRYAPPPAAETVIPSAGDRAAYAAQAPAQDAPTLPNPKRGRLVGALRTMLLGFAIILIGAALVFFMGQQPVPATGQIQTLGIVTKLDASGGSCTPTARFAAGSGSYTATTATAVSPCTFQLGESVSVDYSQSNPDASGRIVVPNLVQQYLWVVPVVGLAVVLVSLLVFVFGAGSLAAGIAIVRDGRSQKASRADRSGGAPKRRRSEPADAAQ